MNRFLTKIYNTLFGITALQSLQLRYDELKVREQRQADMLANKNGKAVLAQSLTVSQHAVFRARTRLNYRGSDDDIRKKLYKLAIRNLAVLDRLSDGEYELGVNEVCRIKDNTVTTVMLRRGSKR